MRFICGTCKDDCRRIFAAESTPTVQNMDDLTGWLSVDSYDWGPDAALATSERTAKIILACATDRIEARNLSALYAEDVVRKRLSTDKMWILPISEVAAWIANHRRVV